MAFSSISEVWIALDMDQTYFKPPGINENHEGEENEKELISPKQSGHGVMPCCQ